MKLASLALVMCVFVGCVAESSESDDVNSDDAGACSCNAGSHPDPNSDDCKCVPDEQCSFSPPGAPNTTAILLLTALATLTARRRRYGQTERAP